MTTERQTRIAHREQVIRHAAAEFIVSMQREQIPLRTQLAIVGLIAANLLLEVSPQDRANWLDCLQHPENWEP